MKVNKIIPKIYIFSLVYFLFIDYKYFTTFALIILFVNFISKKNLIITNFEKIILLISPFIFYIQKIIIGLFYESTMWERTFFNLKYSFGDAKITLSQLICQNGLSKLVEDSFQSMTEECSFGSVRYGPLFHLLKINIDYEVSTFIVSVFLYSFFLFFLYEFMKKKHISELEFNIISLSSVVNLLLSQLNLDLLLFLIVFICIRFLKKYIKLNLFVFFILALLKQHPIGIFFGLLFTEKKPSNIFLIFVYLSLFFGINSYFLFIDFNYLSGQQRPSDPYSSSGLLTISQFIWTQFLDSGIGFRVVVIILIFFVLFIFTIIFKNNVNMYDSKLVDINSSEKYFSAILSWFLFISIYANYDYRNVVLILLLFCYNFKFKDKYLLMALLLLSPIPLTNITLLSYILISLKFSIYIYIVFLTLSILLEVESRYFYFIKKLFKKINQ